MNAKDLTLRDNMAEASDQMPPYGEMMAQGSAVTFNGSRTEPGSVSALRFL
jgi:hypothetical protein